MTSIFHCNRMHVIFSDSGAGWLKSAAKSQRSIPLNISAFDRLINTAGPLSGLFDDSKARKWCLETNPNLMRFSGLHNETLAVEPINLLKKVLEWTGDITVWYSRRSASEFGYYLEFLREFPDISRLNFVDVSTLQRDGSTIRGTGECTPNMIMQAWEKRYELTAEATKIEIEQYSKHFDDADVLRVFVADEFVPKRLDFHDETILNKLCNNWRSLNEVMKEILVPQQSTGYHQIEYFYVLWRLSVLSDINVLEYTGDFEGGDTSGCYIRLRN